MVLILDLILKLMTGVSHSVSLFRAIFVHVWVAVLTVRASYKLKYGFPWWSLKHDIVNFIPNVKRSYKNIHYGLDSD